MNHILTAYIVSPVTGSTFDDDSFGFKIEGGSGRSGYGGNQLASSGDMSPWRVIRGWFGYNERHNSASDGVMKSSLLPRVFSIAQNYPNPFNPSTTIRYEIPEIDGLIPVNLSVYDMRGRLIVELVDEEKPAGRYQVHWDGKDRQGQRVASGVYLYRITAEDRMGNISYDPLNAPDSGFSFLVDVSVGIGDPPSIPSPRTFSLSQNHPNPFNPSTTIRYEIPERDGLLPVNMSVYDMRGRLIRTLVREEKRAGRYSVHWDGRDSEGGETASGAYLYRIRAGEYTSTKKMIIDR